MLLYNGLDIKEKTAKVRSHVCASTLWQFCYFMCQNR